MKIEKHWKAFEALVRKEPKITRKCFLNNFDDNTIFGSLKQIK